MKFLSSFTSVVGIALLMGIIIGEIPYAKEIATISLIIAMSVSISNIPLHINFDRKKVGIAVVLNYIFLSSIILILSIPFYKTDLFSGFVVMASVPSAIAVLPLTKICGGNIKLSLFALVISYLISIVVMPLLIYIFLSQFVNPVELIKNVFLFIVIPIIISRFIKVRKYANEITNIFFFLIIFAVIGMNRDFIFTEPNILLSLSMIMAVRTIFTGWIAKYVGSIKFGERDAISYSLFASFKNEGLVMILASSLFNEISAIPAIIATIFELIWIIFLENKIV